MKINSLEELKTSGKTLVMSCKLGRNPFITEKTYIETDMDLAAVVIPRLYRANVQANRRIIEDAFRVLYGRPMKFKDSNIGEFKIKLQEILAVSGKDIKQTAWEIKNYIGYKGTFFTNAGKPAESARIVSALKEIHNGAPKEKVKQILFG